jgi:hypothetical protein
MHLLIVALSYNSISINRKKLYLIATNINKSNNNQQQKNNKINKISYINGSYKPYKYHYKQTNI